MRTINLKQYTDKICISHIEAILAAKWIGNAEMHWVEVYNRSCDGNISCNPDESLDLRNGGKVVEHPCQTVVIINNNGTAQTVRAAYKK